MKRTYTLVVLLGLVVGTLLTGCSPSDSGTPAPKADAAASTNAPAPAATSTNK